jgi:hypothetical protein
LAAQANEKVLEHLLYSQVQFFPPFSLSIFTNYYTWWNWFVLRENHILYPLPALLCVLERGIVKFLPHTFTKALGVGFVQQ